MTVALETKEDELRVRAERLAKTLADEGIDAEVVRCHSAIGGGGAPDVELPSWGIGVPAAWARELRTGSPPVVGRVRRGRCVLDLRTVAPDDDARLLAAVRAVHHRRKGERTWTS